MNEENVCEAEILLMEKLGKRLMETIYLSPKSEVSESIIISTLLSLVAFTCKIYNTSDEEFRDLLQAILIEYTTC